MAIERRRRLDDGTFGPVEKLGSGLTDKERVALLEEDNAMIAYAAMQKDSRINELEMAQADLMYILMNGGIL